MGARLRGLFRALALPALLGGAAAQGPEADPRLAPREEVLSELRGAPRSNLEREKRVAELFVQAGARPEEVRLEEVPGHGRNVVVVKDGETDRTIVIGAHLDKVEAGNGVIDDWSGASMVANVYQALRGIPTRHRIVFIGFNGEEKGLKGSRAHVKGMSAGEVERCEVMVNLEVLGVGGPYIWTNGSTPSVAGVARAVSRRDALPLEDLPVKGVGADSMAFEERGIPNVTIHGLPLERISLIHSPRDVFENIDAEVYWSSYRLVVAFVLELDKGPAAARLLRRARF